MRCAPWPDFAGNPIHEGDTIRHPHSGESGVVVFLPMYPDPGDAWRVNYGDQYESRLCLQIDNKGMAVVVPATDLPTPKGTPVSIDKQLPAYKSHKTVWALKIASIQQAPVQSVTDGWSWRITPANTTFCPFEVPHSYVQKHRPEEGGYWVQYEDGYQSYSPAKAFEEGYTLVSEKKSSAAGMNLTFGLAIQAMKFGERVARAGWNGKGMFVYLNKGSVDLGHPQPRTLDGVDLGLFESGDTGTVTRLPNINMRSASGSTVTGWLASQSDMLAEDWVIVK